MPGAAPSYLAGRAEPVKEFRSLLQRLRSGQRDRTVVITGRRGVGKTVLLGELRRTAVEEGWVAVGATASKESEFGPQMAALARAALLELAPGDSWGKKTQAAAGVLKSFALTVRADSALGEGLGEREVGRADSGVLADDLADVFAALGGAAIERRAGVVFLIDDIHHLSKVEIEALITAAHHAGEPQQLPITFAGAGLPQLPRLTGDAHAYAEQILKHPSIGELLGTPAREVVTEPARALEVEVEYKAVELIVSFGEGCPRYMQAFAATTWDLAKGEEKITLADAEKAQPIVAEALDEGFFRPLIKCATADELRYLRAMAELGADAQPASDVAELLGKTVEHAAPHRSHLVNKGLLYTPNPGFARFTIPQFERFMQRHMPFEPVHEHADRRWRHFGRHRHHPEAPHP